MTSRLIFKVVLLVSKQTVTKWWSYTWMSTTQHSNYFIMEYCKKIQKRKRFNFNFS